MWKIITLVMFTLLWAYASSQVEELPKLPLPNCFQNLTNPATSFKLSKPNLTDGECYWEIHPSSKSNHTELKVNIFLEFLFLHENDVVTLHKNLDDARNDTSRLVKPLYAQNGSVTVFTKEKVVIVKLKGNDTSYIRNFGGFYHSEACIFVIPPPVKYINSPIHSETDEAFQECHYLYNKDAHHRLLPSFVFEEFNLSSSTIELSGTTSDGPYTDPRIDFFLQEGKEVDIGVNFNMNSSEYFRLRIDLVDSSCSGAFTMNDPNALVLKSPPALLNNGSFGSECRWLVKHSKSEQILGVAFNSLHFNSVYDILAINDGASEKSPPLLQVTTSNRNYTMRQSVRSTGSYLWIAFKPLDFNSEVSFNITVHGQGGYHYGNGTISMKPTVGNDTIFLLEVKDDQLVLLNFTSFTFTHPATLSIYNGFDTSDLLTTLHENVWYPIVSKGPRMMIIATSFEHGGFSADFKGVTCGCLQMSTLSTQSYVLSGNCNSTCMWIIPPQNVLNSDLLVNLQYISLEQGDDVEILRLDAAKTLLGAVTPNMSFVPRLIVDSQIGALVKVTRGICKKTDDIILVGHSTYIPVCRKTMSPNVSELFQVTSPLYPDTYPVLANCRWVISTSETNLLHIAFDKFKLKPNHCVTVQDSDNKTISFEGSDLPDDVFVKGSTVIEFNSSNCKKSKTGLTLTTSEGFVLNGTVADCGGVLQSSIGEFNTSTSGNKTLCIWKVSVPATSGADVNVISYTLTKKDDKKNYELSVFDGASVRDTQIVNNTNSEIWSRSNTLIFMYKRIDVSQPSSVLVIKYNTISCNSTMQCNNKVCMHPDWRCNGVNDCGDYSDETNCGSVPIPPELKETGYNAVSFWVTAFAMLILGGILVIVVPFLYQKYKNGQYRRFGDISVIE